MGKSAARWCRPLGKCQEGQLVNHRQRRASSTPTWGQVGPGSIHTHMSTQTLSRATAPVTALRVQRVCCQHVSREVAPPCGDQSIGERTAGTQRPLCKQSCREGGALGKRRLRAVLATLATQMAARVGLYSPSRRQQRESSGTWRPIVVPHATAWSTYGQHAVNTWSTCSAAVG